MTILLLFTLSLIIGSSNTTSSYVVLYMTQQKSDINELFYLTPESLYPWFYEGDKISQNSLIVNQPFTLTFNIPENQSIKRFRIDLGRKNTNTFTISKIEVKTKGKLLFYSPSEIRSKFVFNEYIEIDSVTNDFIYLHTYKIGEKFDPFFYLPNDLNDELEVANNPSANYIKLKVSAEHDDVLVLEYSDNKEALSSEYHKFIIGNSTLNELNFSLPPNSTLKSITIHPSTQKENKLIINQLIVKTNNINLDWSGKDVLNKFDFNPYFKHTLLVNSNDLLLHTKFVDAAYSPSISKSNFRPFDSISKILLMGVLLLILNKVFAYKFLL